MLKNDMDLLIKKADELRALFILGQRVIPFLEDVFVFVREIQPLLDSINESIKDNLNKMPNASKQLSKVTEATEMATTEIMDIVDGLVYKSEIISSNIRQLKELQQSHYSKPVELLELIRYGISKGADLKLILPEINATINFFKKDNGNRFGEIIDNTSNILQSINSDSSSIMMSLQVQDITSQQIAAVNNLLEMIQGKLTQILNHFQGTGMEDIVTTDENQQPHINVSRLHRDIAFDPDAVESISMSKSRQTEIDNYMAGELKKENDKKAANEVASQQEIDDYFNGNNSEPSQEDAESGPTAGDNSQDDDEISQEEIDRILSGISDKIENDDNNEPLDNDDIDKIFNLR